MASNRSSVHLTLAPVVTMKVHLTPTLGPANQIVINSMSSTSASSRHYSRKSSSSHFCSVSDSDHKYAENVDLEFNKLIECIEEKISDDDDDDDSVGGVFEEERDSLVYPKGVGNREKEELVTHEPARGCKVGNRFPPNEGHVSEERYQKTQEKEEDEEQRRNKRWQNNDSNNSEDIAAISGSMLCQQEKTPWKEKDSFNDRRAVSNHETVLIENAKQSHLLCSSSPNNQIECPVLHTSSIVIHSGRLRDENESVKNQGGFDSETHGYIATTTVSTDSINPVNACSFTTKAMTTSIAVATPSPAIVMTTGPHVELAAPGVSTVSINPVSVCSFITKAISCEATATSSTAIAMTTDQYTKPVDEKQPLLSVETSACISPTLSSEMAFPHSVPSPVCSSNSLSTISSTSDIPKEPYITPSTSTMNNRTCNIDSIPYDAYSLENQSENSIQPHELQVIIPTRCNRNYDDYYDNDDKNPPGKVGQTSLFPDEKPISYSSSISLFTSSSSLDIEDESSSDSPMFTPFWCTLTPVLGTVPPTDQSSSQFSKDTENLNFSCPLERKQAQVHFNGPMSHTLVPKVGPSHFPLAVTGSVNKATETVSTFSNGSDSTTNSITSSVHSDGPMPHVLNPLVRQSQFPHTATGLDFVNKAETFTMCNTGSNPASNFITSHVVNSTTTSATTTTTIVFTRSKETEHDTTTRTTSTCTTTSFPTTCVESGKGYSLQSDCDRNSHRDGGGDDDEEGCISSAINYSPSTDCYFCKTPMTDPDKSARLNRSDEDSGYYYNIDDKKEFSRECPVPQEYQTKEEGTMLKSSVDLYLENVWSPAGVTLEEREPRVRDITLMPGWTEDITSTEKMDTKDITDKGMVSPFTLGKWEKLTTGADDNNNNDSNGENLRVEEDDGCPTMKEFQLDNGRTIMTVISVKKDSLEDKNEEESIITSPLCYPQQSAQQTVLRNENQPQKIVYVDASKLCEVKKETEPRFEISTSKTQSAINKKEEKTFSSINLGAKSVEDNWIKKMANSNLTRRTQPKERNSVRRMTQAIESEISKHNSFSNSAVDVVSHKRHPQVDALQRYKPRRYKSDPFGLFRPQVSKTKPENSEQTTFRSHINTISTGMHSENVNEQLLNIISGKNENASNKTYPRIQCRPQHANTSPENSEQTKLTRHFDTVPMRKESENTNQELLNVSSGRNENESNKLDTFIQFRPQLSKTRSENSEQTTFTRQHFDAIPTRTNSGNINEKLLNISSRENENESKDLKKEFAVREFILKTNETGRPFDQNFNIIEIEEKLPTSGYPTSNSSPISRSWGSSSAEYSRTISDESRITSLETLSKFLKEKVAADRHSRVEVDSWESSSAEHSKTMSNKGQVTSPGKLPKSLTEMIADRHLRRAETESCIIGIGGKSSAFISPVSNSSPTPWSRGSSSIDDTQTMSDEGHVTNSEEIFKSSTGKGADRHLSQVKTDSWSWGSSGSERSQTMFKEGHIANSEELTKSLTEKVTDRHSSQDEVDSLSLRTSSLEHSPAIPDEGHVTSSERFSLSLPEKGADPHSSRTKTDSGTENTVSEIDAPIVKKTTEIRLQLCPPKTSLRLKSLPSVNPCASSSIPPLLNANVIGNELHWRKESVGGETGSNIGGEKNDHNNMADVDSVTSCEVTDADIGYTNRMTINCSSRSSSHLIVKETFTSSSEDKMSQTSDCHRKPVFLSVLKDKECVAGDPLTLQCEVVGWPEPKVSWKFDGIILDEQEPYKSDYDGRTAILQLPELLPTDEGTYTCLAQNDTGQCETNAKLTVLGFAPDIYEPLDSVEAKLGLSVSLQCRTKANPRPKVSWFLNGQRLESNSHVRFSNSGDLYIMNISNLKTENVGCYEFRAINPFGDAMCTAYISIEDSKVQRRTESDVRCVRPEVSKIMNTLSKKMSFPHTSKTFVSKERSPGEKCQVKGFESRTHTPATRSRSSYLNLEESTDGKDLLSKPEDHCRSKDVDRNVAAISAGITAMMNRASRGLESVFQETDSEEESVSVVKSSLLPESSSQITHSTTTTVSTRQILTSCGDFLQTTTTTMTSYDEIEDEDQLHEMMSKVENFEERKKIRARIRELREKKMNADGGPLTPYKDEDLEDSAPDEWEEKRLENEKIANDALKEKVKRANVEKERVMQAYKEKSNVTALTEDRRLQASQDGLKDRQRQADEEKRKKLELYDQMAKQSREIKTGEDGTADSKPAAAASTPDTKTSSETSTKTGDANKENIETKEADSEKEEKAESPSVITEGTKDNDTENLEKAEQPSDKAEDTKEDNKTEQNGGQVSDKKEDVKDSDIKNEEQISDKAEDKKEDESEKTKEEEIEGKSEEKKDDVTETPLKEEEKPEEKKDEVKETPVREDEIVEKPEEKKDDVPETPIKEEETIEKPEENKDDASETPMKEEETIEKPEEKKDDVTETPLKEEEKPEEKKDEVEETPVREDEIVEKPEEKNVDVPETPMKEKEIVEKPEEKKDDASEIPMKEEETIEKSEEKKDDLPETPMKEEETIEKPEEKKDDVPEAPMKEEETIEKPEEKKDDVSETSTKEEETIEKPEEKKDDVSETPMKEEETIEKPEEKKADETVSSMKEEKTVEKPEDNKEDETNKTKGEDINGKPEEKNEGTTEKLNDGEEVCEKPEGKKDDSAEKVKEENKAEEKSEDKKDGAVEKAGEDDGKPKETTETTTVTSKDGKTTTVTTVQTITDKNETRVITTEVTTKTMPDGGTSTKTSKRTKIIQNQMGPVCFSRSILRPPSCTNEERDFYSGGAMAARGGLAPGGRGRGVTRSPSAIKQMLLEWTKAMTQEYSDKILITNFSSSWNNGLAFCALIHHFYPDSFDFDALDPKKRRHNFDLAFDTAEKLADIAPLLDTDDMVRMKNPDWKCVFTYVQSFYRKLQSHERNKAMPKPQAS